MKRGELTQIGAYVLSAGLAIGGAFLISTRFLGHARAQEQAADPATVPTPDPANPPPAPTEAPPAPPTAEAPAPEPTTPATPLPQPTSTSVAQPAPAPTPPSAAPAPAMPITPSAPANSGIAELEGFLEPFIYDIVNRRDPFLPYAEYVPPEDSGPPRALSPAQRWDLEQLKLIGIMWDIKDPKAMFLDPEEEVMILGRDESIGNRNGYIAAIREGEVVVVEAIRKRGDIIYRTRVLRIER